MMLSIDSSAITASAALTDGNKIIRNEFMNTGLTHSETLLPMIKRVMADEIFKNLDSIAITSGPGSFTGIRIGIATAKGLAFKYDTPCIPVSTLEAIAYNFYDKDCYVCAVMDARRMQFYNALFEIKDKKVKRLTTDRAISLEDLRDEIKNFDKIIIAGDGAKLCYGKIELDNCVLPGDDFIYQNAVSVARAAENKKRISSFSLMPVYLRPSQAERELKLKLKEKKQ